MSDHLRFTPAEYAAVCAASYSLPLSTSYSDFQRRLTESLRPTTPALADRIAGLRTNQVRTLRMHFDQMRQPAEPAETTPCDFPLSYDERRAIMRAYALILLRDETGGGFKDRLLTAVEQEMPDLAKKLGQL